MKQPHAEIVLRPARPSDANPLRDFKREILSETELLLMGPEDWQDELLEELTLISRFQAHEGSLLLLALRGDEVEGMSTVVPGALVRSRHVAELGMAVRRRSWRQGIGAAMLQHVLGWAQNQAGLHKLSLKVHEHNTAARQLYVQAGFEYEGLLRAEALCDGHYVDLLAMGRILS